MVILPHKKLKILLIGDSCIDEYQLGKVERISPEAPVPIFSKVSSFEKHGMAYNVCSNLIAMGCIVSTVTGLPSRKTRLIDQKTKQHILRIDEDLKSIPITLKQIPDETYDGIVISDYEKGTITTQFVQELKEVYSVPIFVDTKKNDLAAFEGCIVKVNEDEYNKASSYCSDLVVTLGPGGARYNNVTYQGVEVPVFDVCGAGDTFLAALATFTLTYGNIEQAIPIANRAAAVTVQHLGTYVPSLEEFL